MSLYVIRHGNTDWNKESKIQGRTNIKLNEYGIQQAKEVRNKIEEKDIDLIICSPLDRAKQTAEIINKNMNIPIEYNEKLLERNFGILEGKKADELENWKEYLSYHKNVEVEDGENIQDFFSRVFKFLDESSSKYSEKNVLLVTHGGVARAIDCYFNGIPKDKNDTGRAMLSNCEVREYK